MKLLDLKYPKIEFSERMRAVVDTYNNRRKNEVLDDVVNRLADLIHELKTERNAFKDIGIDYEEKAFYDILLAVSKKYEFEYPNDKMIELSKKIRVARIQYQRIRDYGAV